MPQMSILLVVDDRRENLFVLEQLIAEHLPECRVLTADNAEDGLALAAANSVDAALLDVQMPGVDGIEMCRRFKADKSFEHLPVILITSHGSTTDLRVRGLEAGADDFISRPIDNVELTAKIRVAFRIKRAEDELRKINANLEELVAQRTRQLQTSQDFLQTVIDALPEVTMVIDRNYRVILANRAAKTMAGGQDPEVGCLACYEISHGRQLPCNGSNDPCPLESVFATKDSVTVSHIHRGKDGETRFVEVQAAPIFDEAGNVVQIVEACRDVTDRVSAQREREKAVAELKTRNIELEQFAYTVSHDLKSPLITINGFLGLLEEDIENRDFRDTKDKIGRIVNATTKMHHLLDDVLELSRIGRVVNLPVETPMEELARDVLDQLAGRIAQKGVQVDVARDLPVLYGDRSRLGEVVQNLIENALKYAGDQPKPRIEIGARRDGEEDVFYVRDNGQGIDPRYHEKIFGLFDKLNPSSDGTGIGLALVKRIVEVHGGRVWAESEGLGHGSTFCFTLAPKDEARHRHGHSVARA